MTKIFAKIFFKIKMFCWADLLITALNVVCILKSFEKVSWDFVSSSLSLLIFLSHENIQESRTIFETTRSGCDKQGTHMTQYLLETIF